MNRRALLGAALTAPFLYGCTATRAEAAQTTAPLTMESSGWLIADVTINGGGPYPMVLDTGARITTLSAALIESLRIRSTGERMSVNGAGGAATEDVFQLDEIAFAGCVARSARAVSLTQPLVHSRAMGVLGATLFANTRLELEFEPAQARVTMDARRPPLAGGAGVEIRNEVFVLAPAQLAGAAATAVIDTGAQHTIANMAMLGALGIATDDPRLATVGHARGATGPLALMAMEVGALSTANHEFGAGRMAFGDLPVFAVLGLAPQPAIILGMDRMRRARGLSIDYAEPTLRFS